MSARELQVWLDQFPVGCLRYDPRNRQLAFEYDATWQERPGAYPLSLAMPLAATRHLNAVVEPYLWGLLPDHELILEGWARAFQVSPSNPFDLLAHVGSDCAGAVRLLAGKSKQGSDVAWLGEQAIGDRLDALKGNVCGGRRPDDVGRYCLAGAQPKTALFFDGGRWGVPSGDVSTTHILKPELLGLEGSAHNEHFCLLLARAAGLPAARSALKQFGGETALVIERYDRIQGDQRVQRVHQEHLCQVLGVHPSRKYQKEDGPNVAEVIALLRQSSGRPDDDVRSFVGALVFNWLLAGCDAHGENFSMLIGRGGRARLAPLYDLVSALPYPEPQHYKLRLAMKIGGKYRLRDVGQRQWRKLALKARVDERLVLDTARRMAEELPEQASVILKELRREGVDHPVLDRLVRELERRARVCASGLR